MIQGARLQQHFFQTIILWFMKEIFPMFVIMSLQPETEAEL